MAQDDPKIPLKGPAAMKAAVDSMRSAIEMVKELRTLGGITADEQKAIDNALALATSNTAIAEAEMAHALGYELCKCSFPPTPMLTVGYLGRGPKEMLGPVYECPKCGFDTAGPYGYERTTPPREPK
jgi:hypothetical protein